MTIEATATALAQDELISAPVETPTEAPQEVNLSDELDAIWERNNAEPAEESPDEAAEPEAAPEDGNQTEPDAEDPEQPESAPDAPSELPVAIKKNWAAIPEEARDAFLEAQRESNRKLSEQGRLMQGISPIRDVLADAVKDLPSLADMKPQQVAQEVMALAKMSNEFNTRPVETMLGLIKQHGLGDVISQHLSGQGVTQDATQVVELQSEITDLKRKLAKISDPEYMNSQFDAFSIQRSTQQTVSEFASSKTDWEDVVSYMPQAIEFVKASSAETASTQDMLERAYSLAISQIKPDAIKATPDDAAPKAAPPVDPERSRKAKAAKSVNVTDRGAGQEKPLTERQLMDRIWAKNQS